MAADASIASDAASRPDQRAAPAPDSPGPAQSTPRTDLFPTIRGGPGEEAPSREEDVAYFELNELMVVAYPRLAFILEDPARFMAEMRRRFALQGARAPDSPHAFDVSDWAMPMLRDMLGMVREKVAILGETLEGVERRYASMVGPLVPVRPARIRKLKHALALLASMERELAERTEGGGIDYRRLLQLTSAVTGPLSVESTRTLSPTERMLLTVDRVMQGFKNIPISEYARRFNGGEFVMFEKASSVQGFREVERRFVDAVYDRSKLELIGVPVTFDIGVDVLMRLLPYGILPIGITRKVVPADGFARTPEDFKLHDIRHSTTIFATREAYDRTHGLSAASSARLSRRMDVWGLKLVKRLRALDDAALAGAIRMLAFNLHHDRGYPMVPTSYRRAKPDHVPYLLYVMLRWSGQGCGFTGITRIADAHRWLRDFFAEQLEEELSLWSPEARSERAGAVRKEMSAAAG